MRLSDRVAIVTGGAQGIGGATARRLAEEGAKVLIADVDADTAEQNAATITRAGGTAATMTANMANPEDIQAMVEHALERWGRLDLLVNNAYGWIGGDDAGSALEVTAEGWDKGMAVLAKAIFLATKHAVPHMAKGGGGSIVNISSVHGLLMAPKSLVYEAGKAAVIAATRQMACDFGPLGVRVNCICPGHIVTGRVAKSWEGNPDGLRFFEQQYPVRRTGRPIDIANAVLFLCSEEASFITGHTLVVDGGLTIQLQENLGVHLANWIRQNPDVQLPY